MTKSKEDAYGFTSIRKASNNVATLQAKQERESTPTGVPVNLLQIQESFANVVSTLLDSKLGSIIDCTFSTSLDSPHSDVASQLRYLKSLEVYLQNQLYQVRNQIATLTVQDEQLN